MNQPADPQSGQTIVQTSVPAGMPGSAPVSTTYVTASPPGVAIQLPGSPAYAQQQPPVYAQQQPPVYAQQQHTVVAQPQQQPAVAPQPPAPAAPKSESAAHGRGAQARGDELLPGAGKTVYEFRGDFSEEKRSGGRHQTFFADEGELARVAVSSEAKHTNLSSGRSTWIVMLLGLVLAGGVGAYMLFASSADSAEHAAPAPAPAAEAAAVAAPAPIPEAVDPVPVVDPAGAVPPVDPAAVVPPVDPAVAPAPAPTPAADPAPTPAADPAPAPAPAKKKPAKKKPVEDKPAEDKPAPKPSINPSKPPR